jgi:sugar phosphate isomerase/epimerase
VKLAAQEQLLPGQSLPNKFEVAVAAGWDAIELRGGAGDSFRQRLPELRAAQRAGVVMPTVCVDMTYFIGDFDAERRADAVRSMSTLISVIGELGGRGAMTPASWGMFSRRLPPFVPPRSEEEDRAVLLDALGVLGTVAQQADTEIYLEPLNRYEDHMVNRLDQAVALIREIGLPSVKVVADFFHMNIEEVQISRSLTAAAPYLGHVQVSDSNRLEPGAGHLDWTPALRTLDAIGYDGYLALESRLSGPVGDVLAPAARFLRSYGAR